MSPHRCDSISRMPQILFAFLICTTGFAQDLKPVASALAVRISASGHKTVAVVDFTDLEGNVTQLGRFLAEEISVDLTEASKGFEVIERTHLKVILQEHKLSESGLIDPQTARKVGQIAGADALVTGTITPLGDTIRLSVKVLDTQTAKMIAAASENIPKTPAIAALMGEQAAGSHTSVVQTEPGPTRNSSAPASVGAVSAQATGFVFSVQGCRRAGETLTCSGSVNNKKEKRRQIFINEGMSSVIDSGHNQYIFRYPYRNKISFGTLGAQQELENDLPVNFLVSVEDFNPTATSVTIILECATNDPYGSFKVTLRNIPVENR